MLPHSHPNPRPQCVFKIYIFFLFPASGFSFRSSVSKHNAQQSVTCFFFSPILRPKIILPTDCWKETPGWRHSESSTNRRRLAPWILVGHLGTLRVYSDHRQHRWHPSNHSRRKLRRRLTRRQRRALPWNTAFLRKFDADMFRLWRPCGYHAMNETGNFSHRFGNLIALFACFIFRRWDPNDPKETELPFSYTSSHVCPNWGFMRDRRVINVAANVTGVTHQDESRRNLLRGHSRVGIVRKWLAILHVCVFFCFVFVFLCVCFFVQFSPWHDRRGWQSLKIIICL